MITEPFSIGDDVRIKSGRHQGRHGVITDRRSQPLTEGDFQYRVRVINDGHVDFYVCEALELEKIREERLYGPVY